MTHHRKLTAIVWLYRPQVKPVPAPWWWILLALRGTALGALATVVAVAGVTTAVVSAGALPSGQDVAATGTWDTAEAIGQRGLDHQFVQDAAGHRDRLLADT